MKPKLRQLCTLLALLAGINQAAAQGTAFTYQGRLQDNGSPANGTIQPRTLLAMDIAAGLGFDAIASFES